MTEKRMTDKLFYQDSHLREFTAEVLYCVQKGENYEVVLDQTAFFPEGGGQYADHGTLGQVDVLDVQEKDGEIIHLTDGPLEPETKATGKIDWEERFMKMQQHTGEHIVSGLVHGRFGYNNVGFHLGSEDCTMDFDGEITKKSSGRLRGKQTVLSGRIWKSRCCTPRRKRRIIWNTAARSRSRDRSVSW